MFHFNLEWIDSRDSRSARGVAVAELLRDHAGISDPDAIDAIMRAGAYYMNRLDDIDEAASRDVAAMRAALLPRPTAETLDGSNVTTPPRRPGAAAVNVGQLIRERLEADGAVARVEAARAAELAEHLEYLYGYLGEDAWATLEEWIEKSVVPNFRRLSGPPPGSTEMVPLPAPAMQEVAR